MCFRGILILGDGSRFIIEGIDLRLINLWDWVESSNFTIGSLMIRKGMIMKKEFVIRYGKESRMLMRMTGSEYRVLLSLALEGNEILVNKKLLEEMAEVTGMAISTIRNTIVSLVRKGLLNKDDKYQGIYSLNDYYFRSEDIVDRWGDMDRLVR